MIDRGLFDAYSLALGANADMAQAAIESLSSEIGGASWDKAVSYLKDAYPRLVEEYGAYAAACAMEFYSEMRTASQVREPYVPTAREPADRGILASDVREAADVSTSIDSMLKSLSNRGVKQVMRRADETIWQNARDDPAKPKWALVPSAGACGWCKMIGSRGFDYSSKQTVSNTRHPSCRCIPVVDFDVENPKLEGYDPDGMYERYRQCEGTIRDSAEAEWKSMSAKEQAKYKRKGMSAKSVFMRDCTIAEMNLRDKDWLASGASPIPRFASDNVMKRTKQHELDTARRLANHGFACCFIQDYKTISVNGKKQRIGLPDLENGIEIKAIISTQNALGALMNHMSNAETKRGLRRLIVDNTDSLHIGDAELIEAARNEIRHHKKIPRLTLLLKDGRLLDI